MDKKRIFIVDDERPIVKLVRALLERIGQFEIGDESDPEKALHAMRFFKPDLVLMDISLGARSGPEIVQDMKETPPLHSVPVIFLTGVASSDDVDSGDGFIGGYPFIAKPIDIKKFSKTILEIIGE